MKKTFLFMITVLLAQVATAQKLDRSQKPKPGPAPIITFTGPVTYKLENGMTIMVVENHKIPEVTATYKIDTGPLSQGSKAGVLGLLADLLNEGTTTKTKEQFDEARAQLGAQVIAYQGGAHVEAMSQHFSDAFFLLADAMRNPSFQQASFEKLKADYLENAKSSAFSTTAISTQVVRAVLFGRNHPSGEMITEQTINSITLEDVKAAYKKYITPSRGYFTIAGDITPRAAKELVMKAFGDWEGAPLTYPVLVKVNNPVKTEVVFVNVPDAIQSELTVANLMDLPMSSVDYHAVLLANHILGGGANGKLYRNIRERHGFTYGAYSSIVPDRPQSVFVASAAVRNEKVDSAIVELLKEIKVMRTEKVTPEVLQDAKNLFNGTFALGLQDPARSLTFASDILINELPKDFYRTYLQKINAVTAENILRVSKKYFSLDHTTIVIVGKGEQFVKELKARGFKIRELNNKGDIVNKHKSL